MKYFLLTISIGILSVEGYANGPWALRMGLGVDSTMSGPAPVTLSLGVQYHSLVELRYTYGNVYLNPGTFARLFLSGDASQESSELRNLQIRCRIYRWLHIHTGYSQYLFTKSIHDSRSYEADMSGQHRREGAETGLSLDWDWSESTLSLSLVNYLKTHKAQSIYDHAEEPTDRVLQQFDEWDARFTKNFDPFFHSISLSYHFQLN